MVLELWGCIVTQCTPIFLLFRRFLMARGWDGLTAEQYRERFEAISRGVRRHFDGLTLGGYG